MPRRFLPDVKANWYELMSQRIDDLVAWIRSEPNFPQDLALRAVSVLRTRLEENRDFFVRMREADLTVLIDGNSENLFYEDGRLSFMDAYPPIDSWRIGTFEVDMFRTGADVYALAGAKAYGAYLEGVTSVVSIDKTHEHFYLLYGALISGPYFAMLAKKNPDYHRYVGAYIDLLTLLLE